MWFFGKKENPINKIARQRVDALLCKIGDSEVSNELPKNSFKIVYPDHDNSPVVMGMGEQRFLVYYPKNSLPYEHKLQNKSKFVEILDGCIYDMETGKKFKQGDKIKIDPESHFVPATKDCECYLRVAIGEVNNIWTDICK